MRTSTDHGRMVGMSPLYATPAGRRQTPLLPSAISLPYNPRIRCQGGVPDKATNEFDGAAAGVSVLATAFPSQRR
jgi:hypothetical protein